MLFIILTHSASTFLKKYFINEYSSFELKEPIEKYLSTTCTERELLMLIEIIVNDRINFRNNNWNKYIVRSFPFGGMWNFFNEKISKNRCFYAESEYNNVFSTNQYFKS